MTNVTLELIHRELKDARVEHPAPQATYTQLCKKVGELGVALHRGERGTEDVAEAVGEAIEVAALAVRIATEGSREYPVASAAIAELPRTRKAKGKEKD
jgi:hypothetical protein